MESMYQRNKIQEESMHYETLKQSGELPIIGVNTYLDSSKEKRPKELMRSTEEEKEAQLNSLKKFKQIHHKKKDAALRNLETSIMEGKNGFTELMDTVKYCSLGEISEALYKIGGSLP